MNPDRLRPCVLAVIELATEIWVLGKRKEVCVVTIIRRKASKLRRKRLHGEEDQNIKIRPRQVSWIMALPPRKEISEPRSTSAYVRWGNDGQSHAGGSKER